MGAKAEERRNLTILFADISGFTRLSSRLDPEDVREVVTTCFEILNKPVSGAGGTIHRYEGDSVIAIFGYPVAHEDDPERAVKASLQMMGLIPEVNTTLKKKFGKETEIGLHVGINRGIVVLGEMGSQEKKEYTILGEAVNLASRLKDVANEGEIRVSESVFRESRYLFDYEPCKPETLKGIDEPVRTFCALRMKEKPEPKRGIKGLSSPMVGRERELQLIMDTIRDPSGNKGNATFILGTAGIGKSRLLQELKRSIAEEKLQVHLLEGSGLSYGETLPYWPFLQITKDIYGITDQDEKEEILEKLSAKTKQLLPTSSDEILPYLGYLYSIRFSGNLDEKVKHLDAQALKMQIFMSIKKILSAMAREKPLLLIIEDYHWIDKESLQLLTFLLDTPEPLPISFICLSRVEKDTEPFKTKERLKDLLGERIREIELTPLDVGASDQLLKNLLTIANISKKLKNTILSKAEGNPFYVEEIIRSLIDTEVLEYSNGTWNIATRSGFAKQESALSLQIPDSVQGVIRTRLDRLDPDVRLILENASIIGRSFQLPILEHLCGTDHLMLSMQLAILEEYEYITEHRKQPEIEYLFRHPMLHEVTYNGILKKRRKELHSRTAGIIEQAFANRLDDLTELLAYQYSLSDNTEKAIEWLHKAAQKAKNRYANDEAISYYNALIDLVGNEEEEYRKVLLDCYEALGSVYSLKGDYNASIGHYENMHRIARENKIAASGAKRLIVTNLNILGEWDRSLEILNELEAAIGGDTVDEMVEKFEICALACTIHTLRGELDRALEYAESAVEIIGSESIENSKEIAPDELKRRKAMGMSAKASVFYNRREWSKAIEIWEGVLTSVEEIGDKRAINSTLNNIGVAYYAQGKFRKAEAAYESSLHISETIGDVQNIARTSTNLAVIHYRRGNFNKAIDLFKRGLTISEETGDKRGISVIGANLGIVHCDVGEYERALELFKRQLEISKKMGHIAGILHASRNLAQFYTDQGEYDTAIHHHERAIRSAETLNNKHAMGEHLSQLGSIFLQMNDIQAAKKNLEHANSILEDALRSAGNEEESLNTVVSLAATKERLARISEGPKKDKLLEDARKQAENAMALSEHLEQDMPLAHSYIASSKIYALASKLKKSEDHFAKAIKILKDLHQRRIEARSLLDQARLLFAVSSELPDAKKLARKHAKAASALYKELKLSRKVKECDAL